MRFRKNFKKIVWGVYETDAKSEKEAQGLFEDGEFEQFDNESEVVEEGEWVRA